VVILSENELLEAVANLLLQSISVWEDMHQYAMTYSMEYNAFWGLLDENLKSSVCRYRKQNREESLVPFTMSLFGYYKVIVTKESLEGFGGQYWRKQLKFILTDKKFRAVMTKLNLELPGNHRSDVSKLAHHTAIYTNNQQFATRIG
jgi:hypothetical protein